MALEILVPVSTEVIEENPECVIRVIRVLFLNQNFTHNAEHCCIESRNWV